MINFHWRLVLALSSCKIWSPWIVFFTQPFNIFGCRNFCIIYFWIWHVFSFDFSNKVLDISSGIDDVGGLRWELVAYLALAWITVYFVVWKGLHNSGKVMLDFFFTILTEKCLLFYCLHVAIRVILSIILYGFLFVSISNFRGSFG